MSCASVDSLLVVHVRDTITPALAGHDGCNYASPPLSHAEALGLVRLLIGREPQTEEETFWRCPIAGGQRTVAILPVAADQDQLARADP